MKRITWLVGPPGAGKTTWAHQQKRWPRVVELTDMLAPLVEPVDVRRGILGANDQLIALIRNLELQPSNRSLPSLLVVAGVVSEALFPLSEDEEVLLLLPERDRWLSQLRGRPPRTAGRPNYADLNFAERCYDRLADWLDLGHPITRIQTEFEPDLLGCPPPIVAFRTPEQRARKPLLAVVGQAGQLPAALETAAVEVGRRAVDAGFRVVTGGLDGVMEAASRGARSAEAWRDGCTVGLLPGLATHQANAFVDIALPTGMNQARNFLVAASADVVIAVGGGSGTLSEMALAWQLGKPVIALTSTGGWAAELAGRCLDERHRTPVYAAESPEAAIAAAKELLAGAASAEPAALAPAVRAALGRAGWTRGRQVDPTPWLPVGGGPPPARPFLTRFGGLRLALGPGRGLRIGIRPDEAPACCAPGWPVAHLEPDDLWLVAQGTTSVLMDGRGHVLFSAQLEAALESILLGWSSDVA